MFGIKIIGSSSKGNSYLLKTSEEILLLECGVNYKKILEALNHDISKVVGCLVTHEHKDHSGYAKHIAEKGINVYASKGTFDKIGLSSHRTKVVKSEEQFKAGKFTILPFATEHDCAEPLGFLIQHPEIGKLLFATDTYYIQYKFTDLNYIMVECNYSKEIIKENLAAGIISFAQVKRLLKSHLSLERLKDFLKANDLKSVVRIYLMHLSDNNSHAEDFKITIEKLTGIPTQIC